MTHAMVFQTQYSLKMDKFVGKWQLCHSEKFDEYLKELGVGIILRKLANSSKPVCEYSVEDGWTTVKTIAMKTTEIKFKIDEEFDEVTAEDKTFKSIVRKESDTKFVQTQKREFDNIIVRELVGDEYVTTLQYKNVTCVRKYKRV